MTITIRLGARIRAARKAAGFNTAREFLKKHNFPASTLSQHESGIRIPDDETLHYYSKVFGTNYSWLKTGKGLPYKHTSNNQSEKINEELTSLTRVSINQQLLEKILKNLIKEYKLKISSQTLKIITAEAARIYKEVTCSSRSLKIQKKQIKVILNTTK